MTWDLTSYFPRFDGPEMRLFKEALRTDVAALREQAAAIPPLSEESAAGTDSQRGSFPAAVAFEFIYQLFGIFGRSQRSLSQRGGWVSAAARGIGQGENRTTAGRQALV